MDIVQLKYFIEIVKSGFNLSSASEKLNISQPALSMLIKKFEREENAEVFIRHKRMIVGLSPAGERFYKNACKIVSDYEDMFKELRHNASRKDRLRIGIPPLVTTVVCTDFLNMLFNKYKQTDFIVHETGAYELERKLLLNELDSAMLLKPTRLEAAHFSELLVNKDVLSAFMNKRNQLAGKTSISWSDLNKQSLVIFDDSYMIYHKLIEKFRELDLSIHIAMLSKSWDFLMESVRNSNYITILPSPIKRFYNIHDVVEVPFKEPISWEVIYVYPVKQQYSRAEQLMLKEVKQFFLKN